MQKGHADVGNQHVYLKLLTKVWEIFKGAYDSANTIIIDGSKGKHICNDEMKYVITKGYKCDYVNDI